MTSPMESIGKLTITQVADLVHQIGGIETVIRINRGRLKVTLAPSYALECTTPLDPALLFGSTFSWWKGPVDGNGLEGEIDQDERSLALPRVDWAQIKLITCLIGNEAISGEEKLRRLKDAGHIRFGGNVLISLLQDYRANANDSVLEWLYRTQKVLFLDFFGSILRIPPTKSSKNPQRSVAYLYRDDGEWKCSYFGSLTGLPWEANNTTPILVENAEVNQDYLSPTSAT